MVLFERSRGKIYPPDAVGGGDAPDNDRRRVSAGTFEAWSGVENSIQTMTAKERRATP